MPLGDTMLRSEHTAALAATQQRYDERMDAAHTQALADSRYYLWCGLGFGAIIGSTIALFIVAYTAWLV